MSQHSLYISLSLTTHCQGYSEFRFTRYPSLTPLITAYSKGSDPLNSVGSYWEQPGRSIVDDHLRKVPSPSTVVSGAFEKEERVYFTGELCIFVL